MTVGSSGAIAVDAYRRTSDADIYAVGDAAEVTHGVTGAAARIPLAGPANRHGRLAGEHAATGSGPNGLSASPESSVVQSTVLGTAIVQVFGLSAGITGLSERAASAAGIDCDTAYVQANHHAGYYPDARPIFMKLIFRKDDGRILGAQAVGAAGVDKRIDVVATAIHFRGTIDDLAELDLAYAPQFGSAKDPIHLLASVPQNQRREMHDGPVASRYRFAFCWNIRTPKEFASGSLNGAVNIPLDELRGRLAGAGSPAPDRRLLPSRPAWLRGPPHPATTWICRCPQCQRWDHAGEEDAGAEIK